MATDLEHKVRRMWAWRKRGAVRWLPLPRDTLGIPAMYTLLGLFYLPGYCTPSEFQECLEADLNDVFFNTDDFAVNALYTDVDDSSYVIPGIYNYPYSEPIPDTTIGVQSIAPVFKVQESDIIGEVRKGDRLKLCQGSFRIISAKPDGVGCLDLILHSV